MDRPAALPLRQRDACRAARVAPTPRAVRASRWIPGAAIGAAAITLSGLARAQACCGGASALSPARLELHEAALVGLSLDVGGAVGSFDGHGRFAGPSRGAHELHVEQDLLAALRVLRRGQVSLSMPIVETFRAVRGLSEVGGGLGDTQLALRWDFVNAGDHPVLPGLALTATLTLPTGLPPESASHPLATDATGAGVWRGAFGVSMEQIYGSVLLNLTGAVALRSARDLSGVHVALGPAFTIFGAAGWIGHGGRALALTATLTSELDVHVDGEAIPGSGKRLVRLGITGGTPIVEGVRLQGGIYVDPPIPGVSANEPSNAGAKITVLRSW
jgi:hypothetical protein